jgi:hypothetical protein
MCSVAVLTWIQPAQAQVPAADGTPPAPVEAFYCNLKEGKTKKDVMQVAERFSKWADQNDPSAAAWVLTPQFGMGAELPQLIWLGSNPSGSAFGKGLDAWRAGGGEIAAAFDTVVDCSMGHVLASSVEISAPDGPPGDGVVMFSQCKIDAGSDRMKAIAAHKAFAAAMRAMGSKGSNWLFFPMLGGGNPAYDYLGVSTFNNWSDYGAAYDLYVTGGGWQKAMETYKGVVNCNERPPTVWDVKLVRQGKS